MSADSSSPARKLGDYEVLHQLSAGGMGEVLLARKHGAGGFERLAAIKTIRSDLRGLEQLRAMFLDEAKLLSRLTHPSVAQVYDFGEQDGTLYLVMEYVAGVSFRDLMYDHIPPGVACRAVAQGCRGLHAAHTLKDETGSPLGVVHRDVSPDNLMLTYDGAVQVLDFGIALMRGRSAPVTDFGTVKGKPPYLSPEQVRGETVDCRSDVFSASVVLWELLAGKHLFSGDSIYAIGRSVLEKEIPPPSALNDGVPVDLDEVVLRGLTRNREERFQTALALAEALDSVAGQMKAESLAVYAARELAESKDEHRSWLAEVRGGAKRGKSGRPSHVLTAQEGVEALLEGDAAELDGTGESLRARRRRWSPLLSLALVAAGAVIAAILWIKLGPDGAVAVADADADAAAAVLSAADAALVPPPDDAAPVAVIIDAGIVDAQRKGRLRARPDARARRPATKADARPPARPDAAAVPTGHGFITVVADPFASVRIDGVDIGNTPIIRRRVKAGRHTVEMFTPDTGSLRHRRALEVGADQAKRVVAPRLPR